MAEKVVSKKKTVKKAVAEKTVAKKAEITKQGSFAVIATGGKQYVVHEGDFLNIEKLDGNHKEGEKIEFTEVLLTDNGKTTQVGNPTVKDFKVTAEFIQDGRDKKISVIRFRSKSRYFKNKGHRQHYTRVKITNIG